MSNVTIVGAGPAGTSAALAATLEGAQVQIREKSKFPRHKVCGEFVSPEILPLLGQLGAEQRFLEARPARIERLLLHFGGRSKSARLPEPAYGLSRYIFDDLLLRLAVERGAELVRDSAHESSDPMVRAHGRLAMSEAAVRGRRVFGFKAHYRGPASDAIELHFFPGGYVGINPVEGGATNVCGLAGEKLLVESGFEYDEVLQRSPSLRDRLGRLERSMNWMTTGPLVYGQRFQDPCPEGVYPAGDALSFVDPFTGSGMYCAVLTGTIAGRSAARRIPSSEHLALCRRALKRPFLFASLLRLALSAGMAEYIAPFVPPTWLYHVTRPRL